MFVGDLAYEQYVRSVVMKDDVPVAEGGFLLENLDLDWDRRDAAIAEIAQTFAGLDKRYTADNVLDYIDMRRKYRGQDRPQLHPLAADLQVARERTEPYWKIPEQLFGEEKDWGLIKEWLSSQDVARRAELESEINIGGRRLVQGRWRGRTDTLNAMLEQARKDWRLDHPEADADLADFWGYTPASYEAADELNRKRTRRNLLTK